MFLRIVPHLPKVRKDSGFESGFDQWASLNFAATHEFSNPSNAFLIGVCVCFKRNPNRAKMRVLGIVVFYSKSVFNWQNTFMRLPIFYFWLKDTYFYVVSMPSRYLSYDPWGNSDIIASAPAQNAEHHKFIEASPISLLQLLRRTRSTTKII